MANIINKGKPRGRPFQEGNTFGKGRPKLSEEDKEVRQASKRDLKESISKYLDYTETELRRDWKSKSTKVLDKMIISILVKAIEKGDTARLEWCFQQVHGKWK